MYLNKRVVVAIPAYNEEKSICNVVNSIPKYIDQIIVVDDGSTDATSAVLHSLNERRNLIVLPHSRKKGVGTAIITGYKKAIDLKADIALVMGGDGQMDPKDIPNLLLAIIERGADYAKGNRFYQWSNLKQMPKIRIIGNFILSVLTKFSSGYWHVFDSQCGFTAITTDALRKINLTRIYQKYGYPNSLLMELGLNNCQVIDVPVKAIYGDNHSKMNLFLDGPIIFCLSIRLFLYRFWVKYLQLKKWIYDGSR